MTLRRHRLTDSPPTASMLECGMRRLEREQVAIEREGAAIDREVERLIDRLELLCLDRRILLTPD